MENKHIRIAVTGGAGQIGYALLFKIASGEMFGPKTDIYLNLLELPKALNSLSGVVMELEDCAFPLLKSIKTTDNPAEAFSDIDWALLVGSIPRKDGMERADLLTINANVFIEQGKALSENAKSTCKVLVIGNPCNTNAFITKTLAKSIPNENFFALTMLDQNRAYAQVAKKAQVNIEDIKNLIIWGNHSATQYPDFFNATIKGQSLTNIIDDNQWLKTDFIATVQKRGLSVIQAKGSSSAASAAKAITDTVKYLVNPTPDEESFSVAVSSDGSYGVDKGLMFSFPIRSDGKNWHIVQGIQHNDFAQAMVNKTLSELRKEKETVSALF